MSARGLSRHFHLGTIGVRTVVQAARTHWQAEKWLSEVAWRDFYTMILWHYPKVEHGPLKPQFERVKWAVNPEHLKAWQEGRTGYPIVDAAMRQMNGEAWMHNRGPDDRRVVSCARTCSSTGRTASAIS